MALNKNVYDALEINKIIHSTLMKIKIYYLKSY